VGASGSRFASGSAARRISAARILSSSAISKSNDKGQSAPRGFWPAAAGVLLGAAGGAATVAGGNCRCEADADGQFKGGAPESSSGPPKAGEEVLRTLYPPIEPYKTGYLQSRDGKHQLYYEECGNPNGKPALFLHGGPAAGLDPCDRQFFDPSFYRIILLDQRGAGNSKPLASLDNNTTWHLVDDLDLLRQHCQVPRWHLVLGGSWGSTLALAYAQTYPKDVASMALRGIFLFGKEDMHWLFEHGASEIFPDRWENFVSIIPPFERSSILNAYLRRLTSDDEPTRLEAAKRFVEWEMSISRLRPNFQHIEESLKNPGFFLPFARAEAHFFVHGGWLRSDNQLLEDCSKIKHIPTHIVHGRYDIVCRPRMAWSLHKELPLSTIEFTWDSGHSIVEQRTIDALVRASDRFRELK